MLQWSKKKASWTARAEADYLVPYKNALDKKRSKVAELSEQCVASTDMSTALEQSLALLQVQHQQLQQQVNHQAEAYDVQTRLHIRMHETSGQTHRLPLINHNQSRPFLILGKRLQMLCPVLHCKVRLTPCSSRERNAVCAALLDPTVDSPAMLFSG